MALLEFCGGEKNQSKRFPQGGKEARDIQFLRVADLPRRLRGRLACS